MLIIGGGPHALAVLSALHEKSLAFAQFASDPVFNQRVGIDSLQKIGTGARASLEQRAGTAVSVGSHLRCNPTRSLLRACSVRHGSRHGLHRGLEQALRGAGDQSPTLARLRAPAGLRAVGARELIFRPFEPVDLKNISAECAKLFEDTWVKSHLIKLSRQRGQTALILQPIRVPPIPP